MKHFFLKTDLDLQIQFELYEKEAPKTCSAFLATLPFTRQWIHASVSGQEIWIANAPSLAISQENSSVFTTPGEVVIGPTTTPRNKVAGCMGIYYGTGKGLDGANIFAKVIAPDHDKLFELGRRILLNGSQEICIFV